MRTLIPKVTPCSYEMTSAIDAARRVVELADDAIAAGTFGVGGFLMNRGGQVLAEAVNGVLLNGEVEDPTAHVERQLVDWFFEAKQRGLEASASDLIVVSSLDPCAMCAGSILSAGLNVVSLGADRLSGIHQDDGCPHRMPKELWPAAASRFGLFEVPGRSGRADHVSKILSGAIPLSLVRDAESALLLSLDHVRQAISDVNVDLNVGGVALSSDIFLRLQQLVDARDETIFLPNQSCDLRQIHQRLAEPRFDGDWAFLVDERGSVLLGARGKEHFSPIRSSVLELIRGYVWMRKVARKQFQINLPHQRQCSVIKIQAPTTPEKALMELGALGSFFEGEHLAKNLPALGFLTPEDGDRLHQWASMLPPYYTSIVKISVGDVFAQLL